MRLPKSGAKMLAWLKIARLQFYPMTWIAYTLGAMAQSTRSGGLHLPLYLVGYLILFGIEFCTILVNEYNDYETDRLNNNYSIFTGGTRVLVEGSLSFREVRAGIVITLMIIVGLGCGLNLINQFRSAVPFSLLILCGLILGLGYTMPPLKFSYRGLGEVVVGVTHSPYVILCGFVFQGGAWTDPLPWLISVPLFFSIFAAITLAGLPDRQADEAVGKQTIAVMLGPRRAIGTAIGSTAIAYLSTGALAEGARIPFSLLFLNIVVLPHAALLMAFLLKLLKTGPYGTRINREMALALSYILWFGIIPLASLW